MKNLLSVKKGGMKEIVYDDGDNSKEKGGTKNSDKAPTSKTLTRRWLQMLSLGVTSANVSLKDIGCLQLPNL